MVYTMNMLLVWLLCRHMVCELRGQTTESRAQTLSFIFLHSGSLGAYTLSHWPSIIRCISTNVNIFDSSK